MPKLLGIVGALVMCAGLDLLWQARRELRFWLSTYLKGAAARGAAPIFLHATAGAKAPDCGSVPARNRLACVLGPLLIVAGVALMLYIHL